MRTDRNTDITQNIFLLGDGAVIDWHPRIIDSRMNHAEGVSLWCPTIVVDGFGPVTLTRCIDFVDGNDFPFFRFGKHIAVMKTPPGSSITAKSLAFVIRVSTGSGSNIDNPNFKNITRLSAFYSYWSGTNMHAGSTAGTNLRIHRASTTSVDTFALSIPMKNTFSTGVTFYHPFCIIVGMMGECFHGDKITGLYFNGRLGILAEITPENRFRCGRNVIVHLAGCVSIDGSISASGKAHGRHGHAHSAERGGTTANKSVTDK